MLVETIILIFVSLAFGTNSCLKLFWDLFPACGVGLIMPSFV